MKFLIILVLTCTVCCAQNVLVKFYPDNQPFSGLTNWPKLVSLCSNNVAVPVGWDTVLPTNTLAISIAAKQPIYDAAVAAQGVAQTNQWNANVARLVALYNQIPPARNLVDIDRTSLTNIYASLTAGTNTQAQVVQRVSQLTVAANDLAVVQAGILELLQRLGPVLQSMYKPDQDNTP